ncbi:hypothetical protein FB472_0236 [Rhodoglobus vestalii]|uniref:Uncharacterized protein n=1 Tax=Rhodoglobus vestalii TaxID=193384 RepID=A0A8H2PW10_9MICO|nr:hypothetical protein FB472_0236 [Rhodoglobus vestalii]
MSSSTQSRNLEIAVFQLRSSRSCSEVSICGSHRSNHGQVEDVGLKLHERRIDHHRAIDAKFGHRYFGIRVGGVDDIAGLEGSSFERGVSSMTLVGETGESENGSTGIWSPVGGKEPGERGYKVDTAIVVDGCCQKFPVPYVFFDSPTSKAA